MIALGFGVMWVGYLQAIYGFTLLKGWDVRWKDLANPIHPYQWPGKNSPPLIPKGQILPSGKAAAAAASSTGKGGPPPATA